MCPSASTRSATSACANANSSSNTCPSTRTGTCSNANSSTNARPDAYA